MIGVLTTLLARWVHKEATRVELKEQVVARWCREKVMYGSIQLGEQRLCVCMCVSLV